MEEKRIVKIIDFLLRSSDSVEKAMARLGYEGELTPEEQFELESTIFSCDCCGLWCESVEGDFQPSCGMVCPDCYCTIEESEVGFYEEED